jgi:magnesium-transporting ATPase (P-type)
MGRRLTAEEQEKIDICKKKIYVLLEVLVNSKDAFNALYEACCKNDTTKLDALPEHGRKSVYSIIFMTSMMMLTEIMAEYNDEDVADARKEMDDHARECGVDIDSLRQEFSKSKPKDKEPKKRSGPVDFGSVSDFNFL